MPRTVGADERDVAQEFYAAVNRIAVFDGGYVECQTGRVGLLNGLLEVFLVLGGGVGGQHAELLDGHQPPGNILPDRRRNYGVGIVWGLVFLGGYRGGLRCTGAAKGQRHENDRQQNFHFK